jgi:N-acyl-L-homoserine lactone synthetase
VFVEEQFIEPDPSANEIFRDEFDDVSEHFLAYHESGLLIGSTRLVLPSELGFPTEFLFEFERPAILRAEMCEFGRLAISRDHRGGERAPLLGLIKLVYDCSAEHNTPYIYAFMPRKFIDLLRSLGLVCRILPVFPPGPEVLRRRAPMRGYFEQGEVSPVVFDRPAVGEMLGA